MNELFPTYLTAYDFNQQSLDEFIRHTEPKSQLDEYNNLVLNSNIDDSNIVEVDRFLVKMQPRKNMFDQVQIENFFDTKVSEFSDVESSAESTMSDSEIVTEFIEEVEEEIGDQLAQEQILKLQINELSDTLEVEIEKGVKFKENATQTYSASKDVIVGQRIQLGQGASASDFSDKFPFLPRSEEESELETDKFPFMESS